MRGITQNWSQNNRTSVWEEYHKREARTMKLEIILKHILEQGNGRDVNWNIWDFQDHTTVNRIWPLGFQQKQDINSLARQREGGWEREREREREMFYLPTVWIGTIKSADGIRMNVHWWNDTEALGDSRIACHLVHTDSCGIQPISLRRWAGD